MTKANESKPVVPGQEICIFTYGNDYNDSMSSLESFMSFMDDSEEDHAPIPTKKRSKPRRTGRPLVHQRTAAPSSPPTRSNSNPECAARPSSSPSRWGNKSCKSSPGVPRSTRRLSPTRPRPTLKTNNNNTDLNASAHSAHSLELKMLARQGSDRWGTSALHLSSSFGGHSHETRWQDSKGDLKSESGHESTCLSRWSTSMSSSQMEQISTRPRFPRRMRSVGNANPTTATTAPAGEKAWNNSFVQNTVTTHTSTAVDSTGDDTYSTNKATTGSDVEELSMGWEEQSNRIVVDCSILLAEQKNQQPATATAPRPSSPPQNIVPTNTPMPPPKPAATNKPRPRLPNRQKSFVRNTLSMGMAAKVVLERRDRFVKQRSEPSMVKNVNVDQSPTTVDRIPSDASLFSHSSQGTKSTSTTTAAEETTHKRNLFRRQQSVPQSLLLSSSNGSSSDATTKKGKTVQTGPLAALRKQRSLSCLAISKADIPQLPQRQDSQTSHSTTGSKCVFSKQRSLSCIRVGEKDDTACACSSSKQRSQYHGPQLPKRMPSESSTRSRAWPTNQEEEEDHENDKEEGRKDFADDTIRIDPAPLLPRRQTSMGSLAAATAIVVEQNRAPTLALQEIHENQLGNRRLSLTKQRSAPSALSLRKLLMLDPGSIGAGAADPPPAKGVDKCQRLLDLTGFASKLSDVDLDSTLFTACKSLLPDSSERSNWTDPNSATTNGRPRSLPELSSGSPWIIAQT